MRVQKLRKLNRHWKKVDYSSYGLFKVEKKRGKIITNLWKIITKSLGKIKKVWGNICRSALEDFDRNKLWKGTKKGERCYTSAWYDTYGYLRLMFALTSGMTNPLRIDSELSEAVNEHSRPSANRISVRFSDWSSWDFGLYGIYGIYMHYSLQYRNYRTGRNLTRTFPKIVPKFVLQKVYIVSLFFFFFFFSLGRFDICVISAFQFRSSVPGAFRQFGWRHTSRCHWGFPWKE